MTVALFERGLFSWTEWTRIFSAKRAEQAGAGEDRESSLYYHDWLAALESLVSELAEITPSALANFKGRWERAYRTKPHGEKVVI